AGRYVQLDDTRITVHFRRGVEGDGLASLAYNQRLARLRAVAVISVFGHRGRDGGRACSGDTEQPARRDFRHGRVTARVGYRFTVADRGSGTEVRIAVGLLRQGGEVDATRGRRNGQVSREHEVFVVIARDGGGHFLHAHVRAAVAGVGYRCAVRQVAGDGQRLGHTVVHEAAVFKCDASNHSWRNRKYT